MTTQPCREAWQVEAVRDGRLTGRPLAAAERHIAGCAACSRERSALLSLSSQLRDIDGKLDELALRRLRQLTLARADAELRAPTGRAWQRGRAMQVVLLGAAALALAWGALRVLHPRLPRGLEVVATPSAGAVWTRSRAGDIEYIDLVDGLLSVSVTHAGSAGRLIVRLPDGQVEDVGTKFRVWVTRGRTTEISVVDGAVVFVRPHQARLEVKAGHSWRLPPLAEPPAPPAVALGSVSLSPHAPLASPHPSSLHARQVRGPAPQRPGAKSTAAGVGPFSLSEADNEDAAYLHLVALLREHRNEEARLAAATFLRDFPHACRRVEVERLLESSGGDGSR